MGFLFGLLPSLLVLMIIGAIVVVAVRRSAGARSVSAETGGDIVTYLLLALAMGVAGFATAELVSTAFPGESLVFDPAASLATSISALVVSAPFVFYFWRRQTARRAQYPGSAGWTVYLAIIEVVFVIALVAASAATLNGVFTGASADSWTRVVVFGAVFVFHEYAVRVTPPASDANDLPRVIGSAIGLVTLVIGLIGLLGEGLFTDLYATLADTGGPAQYHPWLAMILVGAPLWWYRWLRPWSGDPGIPRQTYLVVTSVVGVSMAVGAGTSIVVSVVDYLAGDGPAGQHFDFIPFQLAFLLVGMAGWILHRRPLGRERTDWVRAYEYVMAAIGLVTLLTSAVVLTILSFGGRRLVGGDVGEVLSTAIVLVVGIGVWWWFTTRSKVGEHVIEAASWPRRLYHLGVGVITALVSAGSLITTLFILLNRLLDPDATGSLLEPAAITVYPGLAAWYLLATYLREREEMRSGEVIPPFEVTIICSHPGSVATLFPKQALVRVIHRGDDAGPIDERRADEIVAAVDNKPSIVWVDSDGFRIAPARPN